MMLYRLTADSISQLDLTSLADAGLREKHDLQRLLRGHISAICPDTLVIAEEFGQWKDSKRRIDLLALDRDANLVVIELKRDEACAHMDLQATRYAAMVSTMAFEKAVEAYGEYLRRLRSKADPRRGILDFLGWDTPHEDKFGRKVRIVLVAPEFPKELTTAVIWLNHRGLDIRCIRILLFSDHRHFLVLFNQEIPLPAEDEYQVCLKGG